MIFTPIQNAGYIIKCQTRTELEDLIVKVIYSKRVISVMQELIRINQVYKAMDKGQDELPSLEET